MPNLNVAIDASGAESGANRVNRALASIGRSASSIAATAFNPLTAAFATLASGATMYGLAKAGDQMTTMASQLEYLGGGADKGTAAMESLFKMSQQTGTGLVENSKALTRFALASEMTGLSMEQNVDVLGGLNRLMIATGTSGQEASAAMIQLGQALASGKLNGDEFRSMAENAPGVMNEMAKALGVTRGELRQMAEDSELTSEVVGKALADIAADAGNMELPRTVAMGWNLVKNAFMDVWGAVVEGTGIIDDLYTVLESVANWITENKGAIVEWAINFRDRLVEMWPTVQEWFWGLVNLWETAAAKFSEVWETLAPRVTAIFWEFWNAASSVFGPLADLVEWAFDYIIQWVAYLQDKFRPLAGVIGKSMTDMVTNIQTNAPLLSAALGLLTDAAKGAADLFAAHFASMAKAAGEGLAGISQYFAERTPQILKFIEDFKVAFRIFSGEDGLFARGLAMARNTFGALIDYYKGQLEFLVGVLDFAGQAIARFVEILADYQRAKELYGAPPPVPAGDVPVPEQPEANRAASMSAPAPRGGVTVNVHQKMSRSDIVNFTSELLRQGARA